MSFVSVSFFVLLLVVLLCRLAIGQRSNHLPFLVVLLAASLIFYAWHTPSHLALLVGLVALNYIGARAIDHTANLGTRKLLLIACVGAGLGLLAYYKYADFIVETSAAVVAALGLDMTQRPLTGVILPIGISFFVFQAASYTIDVYRGDQKPAQSFWRFLLFISFFPQLVAGPIVRGSDLLYQFARPRRVRTLYVAEAVRLCVRGLFLKVVIADNIADFLDYQPGWSEGAWSAGYASGASSTLSWLSAWLFSAQIFCDFAGYSDIARGLGYALGFRLPINFNFPYIAQSFSEFWRRWHITLSTWLRDYLYVPLGGGRGSRARTAGNLLLVMMLGGLWHGAAWTFVLWGTLHGIGLAVERITGLRKRLHAPGLRTASDRALAAGWFLVVQATVVNAWVLFRSDTLTHALAFYRGMYAWNFVGLGPATQRQLMLLTCAAAVIPAMHLRAYIEERYASMRSGPREQGAWTAVMLFVTLTFYGRPTGFLYYQF